MLFETTVNYYPTRQHGITSLKTKFFTVAAAEPQNTTVLNLLQNISQKCAVFEIHVFRNVTSCRLLSYCL